MTNTTPARPLIDFSGLSRETARNYAKAHVSRVNKPETNTTLRAVAAGEQVDAYALNEALLDAMRGAATRAGQSPLRRIHGREIAYLGHIAQAVLEAHADDLPAYAEGDRSRAVEAAKEGLRKAKAEIDRLLVEKKALKAEVEENHAQAVEEGARLYSEIRSLSQQVAHDRAVRTAERVQWNNERAALTEAASAERRRLVAEINFALGLEGSLNERSAAMQAFREGFHAGTQQG